MVRLLVPEGEGQLPHVLKPPPAIAAEGDLVASPWRCSIAATAVTASLALVGRSRPGVFLKSVALISAVDLTWTASGIYGRHELNRAIFQMENIQPQPSKLWERTKHWTSEDATLAGGALGIFMALNPRALPGAHGFLRFFGAATVGCALGSKVGEAFLVRLPPHFLHAFHQSVVEEQQKAYQKLQSDDKARASLSRIGKLALWYHTSSLMNILRSPIQIGRMGRLGGLSGGPVQAGHGGNSGPGASSLHALKADLDRQTFIEIEFKEDELAGPDVQNGYRIYRDDLKSRDPSTIQAWLEHVQRLKKRTIAGLQCIWPHLAQREQEFYQHLEEDREKDIFRRELELLNNMAADFVTRYAILGYLEHDALKQLQQTIEGHSSAELDAVLQGTTIPYKTLQHSTEDASMNYHGPTTVAEQVRTTWVRQKELLRHMEHEMAKTASLQPEEGTHVAEYAKRLQRDAEQIRKNIEAAARLLRWLEEQVRDADEEGKGDSRHNKA